MPAQTPSIRPPAVAGQFYPGDSEALRLQVEDLLARAPDARIDGAIAGLLAPHAGYPYSGQTAADAFGQVRGGDYDAVVIIAPSHREPCNGASIYPGDGYRTPLGVVDVHRELARAIANEGGVARLSQTGHRVSSDALAPIGGEHAVEVQLPFLQVALPGVAVVPILMDNHNPETCRELAAAVAGASVGLKVLLVASSDLYHGHSQQDCIESDRRTLEQVVGMSPNRLSEGLAGGGLRACGSGPILALVTAAGELGATEAHLISRTNSAEPSGASVEYVVGYGSVVFVAGPKARENEADLDPETRAELGQIARAAVLAAAEGQRLDPPDTTSGAAAQPGRAFVTLFRGGRLRGCIGDLQGDSPLGLTVQQMALAAADRDPRFPPLAVEELPDLEIEISVLGAFRTVQTPDEIRIGTDGLWLRLGTRQGVLLPKVADEYGWSPEEFLEHACQKAQLPPVAWHDPDADIQAFPAEVFSV